jgi:hypothetical protein
MILGYALARLRPRTLIVQARRGRRRGFDVLLSPSSEDSP